MSDFIKIIISDGPMLTIRKDKIMLSKDKDIYYLVTGFPNGNINGYRISKVEYDKICKELGV